MNWKKLSIHREVNLERFIVDQETRNTKDYKKLNDTLLKHGFMRSHERVVAIEYKRENGEGLLSVIVG